MTFYISYDWIEGSVSLLQALTIISCAIPAIHKGSNFSLT